MSTSRKSARSKSSAKTPRQKTKAQPKAKYKAKTKTRAAAKAAVPMQRFSNLPGSLVLRRSNEVLARRNPDGVVAILRLDNDQYFYNVDGIAAELWHLIDGKTDLGTIKKTLILRFKPPVDRFEKDVAKLLTDLRREKLIET